MHTSSRGKYITSLTLLTILAITAAQAYDTQGGFIGGGSTEGIDFKFTQPSNGTITEPEVLKLPDAEIKGGGYKDSALNFSKIETENVTITDPASNVFSKTAKTLAKKANNDRITSNPFSFKLNTPEIKADKDYKIGVWGTTNSGSNKGVEYVCFQNSPSDCDSTASEDCLNIESSSGDTSGKPGDTLNYKATVSISSHTDCSLENAEITVVKDSNGKTVKSNSKSLSTDSGSHTKEWNWNTDGQPTGSYTVTLYFRDKTNPNKDTDKRTYNVKLSKPKETECNDDTDNADLDSLKDEDDPGCVPPYTSDDSENSIYDLDATKVFKDSANVDNTGPTIFYGWKVVDENGDHGDVNTGSGAKEKWIEEAGSQGNDNWGGGDKLTTTNEITITDGTGTTAGHGYGELIDVPRENGGKQCGDTQTDSGEHNFNCPEDYGLPDDIGSTAKESANSITKKVGQVTGPTDDADNSHDIQDKMNFQADLTAQEFTTEKSSVKSDVKDISDICTTSSCISDTKVFEDYDWKNVPDFYQKSSTSDSIWMIYPERTKNAKIGTVEDVGLKNEYVEDYDSTKDAVECDSYDNCNNGTFQGCESRSKNYEEKLDKDTTNKITASSQKFTTSKSKPDINVKKDSQDISITVTNDDEAGTGGSYYYQCSTSTYEHDSCGSDPCNLTTKKTGIYYSDAKEKHVTGYKYATRTFRFEDLVMRKGVQKAFDVNPNENPSSTSPKQALFNGDDFKNTGIKNIIWASNEGQAYYSYKKTFNSKEHGNNPAISTSNFASVIRSGKFVSKRTNFASQDADGMNGQGDGFAAINDGTVKGSTNNFLIPEEGFSFGTTHLESSSQSPSCPSDYSKCIASVDTYLANVDDWGTPGAAKTGVKYDYVTGNPYALDKSMGVCMMYKSLTSDQSVTCQYENSDTNPAPTPSSEAACGDDDPDNDGVQEEYWAYMEGPEVDEGAMRDYPAHYEACIGQDSNGDNTGTIHSCVYNGTEVQEGYVANVSATNSGGYEAGAAAPDYEVCLNIKGKGDEVTGDNFDYDQDGTVEDTGGEWYDLDNENIRSYVFDSSTDSKAEIPETGSHNGKRVGFNLINKGLVTNLEVQRPSYESNSKTNNLSYKYGLAMEDDCDSELSTYNNGCDDTKNNNAGVVGKLFRVGVSGLEPNGTSAFTEAARPDEYNYYKGFHNRVQVKETTGTVRETQTGSYGTNQSKEVPPSSSFTPNHHTNSEIDPKDDQWGFSSHLTNSIGNNGTSHNPGQCYGNQSEMTLDKSERIYANSYAAKEDYDSDGIKEGIWVDPDRSSSYTEITCDLTQGDYGIGYDTDGASTTSSITSSGVEVKRDLLWDNEETIVKKSNNYDQTINSLQQHPKMCGDDANEYLIRNKAGSEQQPPSTYQYACADRQTDCVYNGRIYSEGGLVDISGGGNENGEPSNDKEVCLNINKNDKVGGEFYDLDNETIRNYITSNNVPVKKEDSKGRTLWHNGQSYAKEAKNSAFNPITYSSGYALEDDCDSDLAACDDSGSFSKRTNGPVPAIFSYFNEGEPDDDSNVFNGVTVRAWVGGSASHTSTNSQPGENPGSSYTDIKKNGKIDSEEDTWAIAQTESTGVGPKGQLYETGTCYEYSGGGHTSASYSGGPSPNWDYKSNRIRANSIVVSQNVDGDASNEGNWVDPDNNENSASTGLLSCDLNSTDWGYGYDTGSGFNCIEGACTNPSSTGPVVVSGNVNFDQEHFNAVQNEKTQYPSACGDDRNEYLIRENRAGNTYGEEFQPELTRNNIFVCADRPNDCAYNGKAYSEGQKTDIASESSSEEQGEGINDPEICLDLDTNVPGGEWYDLDNNNLKKSTMYSTVKWSSVTKYAKGNYFGENPGTDQSISTLEFFNASGFQSSNTGSTSPIGYATEDDCDSDLAACDDEGTKEKPADAPINPWFNAGTFTEGSNQDNLDTGLGYKGKHNKMQDSSNQLEPGAETSKNWNNVYGAGWEITDLQDSTPGPDKWGLSDKLTDSISNSGKSISAGSCYPTDLRTSKSDNSVTKKQKIFGNSYAYPSGGQGVWEDPDDLSSSSTAKFSCDITGPDKGYGFDDGSDSPSSWYWKNTGTKTNKTDSKVVIGNIAFDKRPGDYVQEPNVCGDDNKEYLLEELGEAYNSESYEGRWACGTTTSDCVSRAGGEYSIYHHSEYVNTAELGEKYGRLKKDQEICDQRTGAELSGFDGDEYGTWYDQDYKQKYCQYNTLYRNLGIRWIDKEYINNYPNAVTGGLDDDINPLLYDRLSSSQKLTSTQGDPSFESGETPVPTGKNVSSSAVKPAHSGKLYQNSVATIGFCAGDDSTEYLVTQQCNNRMCETDRSVLGVASTPGACILDGSNFPQLSTDKRKIYSEGEKLTFDLGASKRTIACFDNTWYGEWPVVFEQDKLKVGKGETRKLNFRVINVDDQERTYTVELRDTKASQYAKFASSKGTTFQTTIPAKSSKQFQLEIYGGNTNIGTKDDYAEIELYAEAEDTTISGSDNAGINIVKESATTGDVQKTTPKNVPGIGAIHLLFIMLMSIIYYFRQS